MCGQQLSRQGCRRGHRCECSSWRGNEWRGYSNNSIIAYQIRHKEIADHSRQRHRHQSGCAHQPCAVLTRIAGRDIAQLAFAHADEDGQVAVIRFKTLRLFESLERIRPQIGAHMGAPHFIQRLDAMPVVRFTVMLGSAWKVGRQIHDPVQFVDGLAPTFLEHRGARLVVELRDHLALRYGWLGRRVRHGHVLIVLERPLTLLKAVSLCCKRIRCAAR